VKLAARAGGVTVRFVVRVPPSDAVIVTCVAAPTAVVVTENDALVLPLAIVTEGGTAATAGLLLVRVTVVPPAGAAAEMDTEPGTTTLPTTVAGVRVTEEIVGVGFVSPLQAANVKMDTNATRA